MQKILAAIMLTLLISPAYGMRQEIYTKVKPSDEGIHAYFSDLLKDAARCLDRFLDEDVSGVNISISFHNRIKLIQDESRFYALKGVKTNVSRVVEPFLLLSTDVSKLTQSQSSFLESLKLLNKNKNNYSAYLIARTSLINMKLAADGINSSVKVIKQIVLWNGTSRLSFDVSGLESRMKDIYNLISFYSSQLSRFENEGLVVVVSNTHPHLYEKIKIYVYAKNVTPESLFIDQIKYPLINSTMEHGFNETGEHTVYAEGIKNGRSVRSNIVKIHVGRIPTSILLSSKPRAFINERVRVKGVLLDYLGNPVHANISVKIDGNEFELTANNGFFSFNVTKRLEGILNVSASYAGNETYEGSDKSISILFSRIPISLYIQADRTQTGINGTVNFTGRVYGANHPIPIHIAVNSTDVRAIESIKEFNYSLKFKYPGKYVVYAYFPGSELYKPAKSNMITIEVATDGEFLKLAETGYYYLLIVTLIAAVSAVMFVRLRKKDAETTLVEELIKEEMEIKEDTDVKKPKIPESVEEAYKLLFITLTSRYSLKKSLTPRELLETLKEEPFSEKLNTITELHEKAVYGEVELNHEEREIYFRLIHEILEGEE